MTISQRLNDVFTLAVEALPPEPHRMDAEALEELTQGISPLNFDATLPLVRRWLDLPLDIKPAVEYERFLDDCRLRVCDFTGFLFWLLALTGEQNKGSGSFIAAKQGSQSNSYRPCPVDF